MQQFISSISKFKSVGVFSHLRPDGDALGSQVAFSLWLSSRGVNVHAFNDDPAPENLAWLLNYFPIRKPTREDFASCDAFVFLDGNALHRFGPLAESLKTSGRPLFMIDHHPEPESIFQETIHDVKACATAQLVFFVYLNSGLDRITKEACEAIYTGMMTDTGSFRFDSVTDQTHTIISELIRLGGLEVAKIHEKVFDQRTAPQIELLGLALSTIKNHGDGFVSMFVSKEMLQKTGCTKEDTEGFTQYPMSVKGTNAIVFALELGNRIKFSFRTRQTIDANVWARKFEGGGHVRASGGWFTGSLTDAIETAIQIGKQC
jgi:phosphoesterase RecJ-like protein